MSECQHINTKIEKRQCKTGSVFRAHCSCGEYSSGWHYEEWQARQALRDDKQDTYSHRDFIGGL